MNIFHILPREHWEEAQKKNIYKPESLNNEGFIHCSKTDQLVQVANNFYKGEKDLIIIRINAAKVEAEIKIEPPLEAPLSGIVFPHIYGPLNIDSVEGIVEFPVNEDGTFELPQDLIGK